MRKLKLGDEARLVQGHAASNHSTLCLVKQPTFIISHGLWAPGAQGHLRWVAAAHGRSRGCDLLRREGPRGPEGPRPSSLPGPPAGAAPRGVHPACRLPPGKLRGRGGQREGVPPCLLHPDLGSDTVTPASFGCHSDRPRMVRVRGAPPKGEAQEAGTPGAAPEGGHLSQPHLPALPASAFGPRDKTGGTSLWGRVASFGK